MITVEHWAEIRRLHKVERLSKRAIASRLGIHRDTVTRALAADTPPTYEREPRGSILDPYKPKIHALLTQDPNLSGVRIQEIIAGEGYPGKISILRGFLREIRPQYKLPPVYIRMDYHPAEYAQIDWGEMPDPVLWEGHLCKVHAFVMVMCFSRLLYVEFSLATKLEDFLRCHQNGLHFFGGSPKSCVYDNLSSVVKRRRGTDITLNERFQQFAGYYYFEPHPCWPNSPNQKGAVERPVDYIKGNFWAGRYFADFTDLDRQRWEWLNETANARVHSVTRRRPVEHFEEERDALLQLPPEPFDTDRVLYPVVSKDCVVRVDTNDYSVPWRTAQRHRLKKIEVRVDGTWVRIVENGEEVARHARSFARHQQIIDRSHYDGLLSGENFAITTDKGEQTIPDVAYNEDDNNYLVVWRTETTTIHGRIVNASGSLSPTVMTLASSVLAQPDSPAVAYSPSADHWLVAWEQSGMAAHTDIWARGVDGGGTTQTAYAVYNATLDDALPDVAANDEEQFLVVWQRDDGASSFDIHARRVTTVSVANAAFTVTTSSAGIVPQVVYNADDDEYLVVWQDPSTTYDTIWGQRVLGDHGGGSQLVGSAFQVSDSSLTVDCATPAVTYFTTGTLESGIYLVAWKQQAAAATTDLMARRVETDGTVLTSNITLCDADDDQSDVALAFGPAITETLAVWTDKRNDTEDIYAVIVEADGDVGNDFIVHSLPGDQQRPQIAYNPDDDEYMVVWQDYRGGTYADIYAQRVTGAGVLTGDNITVTSASYNQTMPHVAYATSGDVYLVAWRHYSSSATTQFNVYGQIISHTGTLSGSNFTIAEYGGTPDRQSPTDVVYNSDLDYFLVLYKDIQTGYWNIWGRHVSSSGVMSDAVQITVLSGTHETEAVGAYSAPDDLYLIVYMYRSAAGQPDEVYGRRMWGNETVVSTETIQIATGAGDQQSADVVYLAESDRYVVVWEDDGAGDFDVYGQLVKTDGTLDGSNYTIVNESGKGERLPCLTLTGYGGAVVVWQRDNGGTDNCDLYGQRLGTNGATVADPFTILSTDDEQQRPVIAADGSGSFLLAWQDDRNGNWDIYGSLFQPLLANFTASPAYGAPSLEVTFSDASTPSGVADEWYWTFDTVGTSSLQNPSYTYTQTGFYTVSQTVTDTATGEWDVLTRPHYIAIGDLRVITYTYDGLNRLIKAEYSTGEAFTYTYSAVGNRLTMTKKITTTPFTTVYEYDAANRLTKVDDVAYTWDDRGNLISDGTFDYAYDAAGRMVQAKNLTNTLVYTYNGEGLRVAQSVDGAVTTFVWDLAVPLAQVLRTGDGARYVHGLDLIAEHRGDAWAYPLGDALGSVRQWTDGSGAVSYAGGYTPFGVEMWAEGSTSSAWGYTGEWWDGSAEMLYLRARWYEPLAGRFTSPDPIIGNLRNPQSLNRYLYALANPLRYTDPSGHIPSPRPSGVCPAPIENPRRMPEFVFAPSFREWTGENQAWWFASAGHPVWVYCGDFYVTAYQFVTEENYAGASWYENTGGVDETVNLPNGTTFTASSMFVQDVIDNGTGRSASASCPEHGNYFHAPGDGNFYCGKGRPFDPVADAHQVVAVDPNVVSLGAKIYVPELEYGPALQSWGNAEFTAADTGGVIQRNRIDVFTGEGPGIRSGYYNDCPSCLYKASQHYTNGIPTARCGDRECLGPVGVYQRTTWPYLNPCEFGPTWPDS